LSRTQGLTSPGTHFAESANKQKDTVLIRATNYNVADHITYSRSHHSHHDANNSIISSCNSLKVSATTKSLHFALSAAQRSPHYSDAISAGSKAVLKGGYKCLTPPASSRFCRNRDPFLCVVLLDRSIACSGSSCRTVAVEWHSFQLPKRSQLSDESNGRTVTIKLPAIHELVQLAAAEGLDQVAANGVGFIWHQNTHGDPIAVEAGGNTSRIVLSMNEKTYFAKSSTYFIIYGHNVACIALFLAKYALSKHLALPGTVGQTTWKKLVV
jgi:hypothetical protein